MSAKEHCSMIKLAMEGEPPDGIATVEIHCPDCGEVIRLSFPAIHIATLGSTMTQWAQRLGLASQYEVAGEMKGSSESIETMMNERRKKAHLN